MITFESINTEQDTAESTVTEKEKIKSIILYNDDVNSFDFVIELLIEICDHNNLQAEQCAYLVHHTGKCSVKCGTYEELEPLCEALLEKGLSAKIE